MSFFAFLLSIMFWTGCQYQEEIHGEISPQATESACKNVQTTDIDLSRGFSGNYNREPDSSGVFRINDYRPNYPLKEGAESSTCEGVCALQLTFQAYNYEHPVELNSLYVTSVTLHTTGSSGSQTFDVQNYEWNYPELTIALVMSNEINSFEISFASAEGDMLSVVDAQVVDGLCVIDNIDLVDELVSIDLGDGLND